MPLAIWLAINFFAEIPKEVYESAEMDGCSEYKLYWYIAVPLVKAGMVVIAILVFIGAWNEFGLALVLQASDAKKTLPIGIASKMCIRDREIFVHPSCNAAICIMIGR